MSKQYYAAHSYMGLNFTYDSPCWKVYIFDTAKERDQWVETHEYNGQNYVAMAVSLKTAKKIIGTGKRWDEFIENGYGYAYA